MDFTGSESEAWTSGNENMDELPESSSSVIDPVENQDADIVSFEDSTQPQNEIITEGGIVSDQVQDGQLIEEGIIVTENQEIQVTENQQNNEPIVLDSSPNETEALDSPSGASELKDSIYTLVDKLQVTNELLEKSAENTTELQDEPNILQVEEQATEGTTYTLDDVYTSLQEMNSNLEYIQDYQKGSIENDQTFYRVEVATGLFIAGLLAGLALFLKFYG